MVSKQDFGALRDGRAIALYTIAHATGASVQLITYGATLQSVFVPDQNGRLSDVILGFDSIAGHEAFSAGHGKTIGRYANRIAGGSFCLNGACYNVTKNEDDITCLHGGGEFGDAVWDAEILAEDTVRFTYSSPQGAHGFPGAVDAAVTYRFTPDNCLEICFEAVPDRDTILNLTNHAYFNLSGAFERDVLGHVLQINADCFTPTDAASIPTGELQSVAGTPFDFRAAKPIGQEIHADETQLTQCKGYDHNFCLNQGEGLPAAVVFEPESGREMRVFTDLPGVQLYTGNFLDGESGKNGIPMRQHAGFCLETQYYPDTPNKPEFPSCTVRAGETFRSTTSFCFAVVQ